MVKPPLFLFTVAFLSVALTGCVDVTFPEPMPAGKKNLTTFPSSWQGDWVALGDGGGALFIREDRILDFDGDGDDDMVLGRDCVLRRMGRRLVVSFPQSEGSRYTVWVAEKHGNELHVVTFDGEKEGNIRAWKDILGPDRVLEKFDLKDDEKELVEVQLNPKNKRQFKRLVKSCWAEPAVYFKTDTLQR